MGEQLWELLSKAGFDVFLDRFSIEPAENFQERLTERLGDKSFVLLVESPDAHSSPWVLHEINYAVKHRLGFMTITWPETRNKGLLIQGVFDGYRVHMDCGDIEAGDDGQMVVSSSFAEKLVSHVETRHAQAMLRSRRQLLGSIIQELRRQRLPFTQLSEWTVIVKTDMASPSRCRIISVTPRPPEVPDVFLLHSSCLRSGLLDGAILVHSTAALAGERAELLRWAVGSRNIQIRSEDEIVSLVSTIKKG